MKWYFTFGDNHTDKDGNSLGYRYVIITGEWGQARDRMWQARKAKWSFQYSEDDFLPQIEKYNLKKISLEEVILYREGVKI